MSKLKQNKNYLIKKVNSKVANLKTSGFTLIEVTLSVFFAGTIFVSMYSLFSVGLKYDWESRYEVLASNLAQEGVEIIRNVRDENVLKEEENFLDGIENDSTCYPYFDTNFDPHCDDSQASSEIEFFDGYYRNCSLDGCEGENTSLERSCEIGFNSEVANITCTVSWDSFAIEGTRQVEVKSVLTDWQ